MSTERAGSIPGTVVREDVVPPGEAWAEVVKRGRRLLALAQTIEHIGNKNVVSDARVAAMLAKPAIDGASENVRVNLAGMSDQARAKRSGLG